MNLVQIDLRRGRDPHPAAAAPAVDSRVASTRRAGPGPVLGVGVILLVPLAEPALRSGPTLALLLVGLMMLGLIVALFHPGSAEVDAP